MTSPATESAELLRVRRDAGVWFARLNRPDKRNALSNELVTAIGATCERVAADLEARALVLHGADFCAGADFAGFVALMQTAPGRAEDPIATYTRQFGAMLEQLAALPVPTGKVTTIGRRHRGRTNRPF